MEFSSKTVTVHGKLFSIGLFWQLLTKKSKDELNELAKQIDFDLYAEDVSGEIHQVGFTSIKEGGIVRAPSLALQILQIARKKNAENNKKSFKSKSGSDPKLNIVAAFEIADDAWYWLVVRAGVIQPDTDCIHTQDQLIEKLLTVHPIGGWNAFYLDKALDSLNLSHAQVIELPKLLSLLRPHAGTRLKAIRSKADDKKSMRLIIGAAIGISALLGIGYYQWTVYQETLLREEQERLRAQKPPPPPPPPWDTRPRADDFIKHCLTKFTSVLSGGWDQQDYECTGDSITQTWARGEGSLATLYKADPKIVLDTTNQRAQRKELVIPLPGAGKHMEVDFGDLRSQHIQLVSKYQLIEGVQIAFKPISDASAAEGVQQKIVQTEFEATLTDIDPRFFISTMPSGTRLEKISNKGGSWVIKGILYGFDSVSK